MFAFSYLQMNLVCLVLLYIILRVHLRGIDNSAPARTFTMLLISVMVYAVFDLICGLIENDAVPTTQFISSVANLGFFISSYFVSYLSHSYAEHELDRPWVHDARKRRLMFVPFIVLIVLTFLTLRYHFFFHIDAEGNYIKDWAYVPMLLCAYSYIIWMVIKMFYYLRQPQFYVQKRKLMSLASFAAFPLIAGVAQAVFTGVSLIVAGATISMVQVFVSLQETRITIDQQTGVNNRTRLMQVFESQMLNEHRPLYFVMMDLDHFKEINDRYGHLEGDNALMAFAAILRSVCARYSCMLARYGGDEFVVLLTPSLFDEGSLIEIFRADVQRAVAEHNAASRKPYKLNVSIGWAKRSTKLNTIPELIAAADAAMYAEKQRGREVQA